MEDDEITKRSEELIQHSQELIEKSKTVINESETLKELAKEAKAKRQKSRPSQSWLARTSEALASKRWQFARRRLASFLGGLVLAALRFLRFEEYASAPFTKSFHRRTFVILTRMPWRFSPRDLECPRIRQRLADFVQVNRKTLRVRCASARVKF
jgi:hypothetical protein